MLGWHIIYYLPDLDLNRSSSQLQTIDNWLSSQAKPQYLESQPISLA